MPVRRHAERFLPQLERVLLRPRDFEPSRARMLIQRVLARSESEVRHAVEELKKDFGARHRELERTLLKHYEVAAPHAPAEAGPWHKLLIGAYYSMEYAIEAAAFFNPSLVPAPNQDALPEGDLRVIFSFRAVGEGHISSVVFREAVQHADGSLEHSPAGRKVEAPATIAHEGEDVYKLGFDSVTSLDERVIFPVLEHERNGIEDARFVLFRDDDGKCRYYATYTAYDGRRIQPRLLETVDFVEFKSHGLSGAGAVNKNLALFPRKLGGRYAMLSRIDGVNNFLMFSDTLTHWEKPVLIDEPRELWELGNSGNCGSPLETGAGWLVITHGVGPLRRYVLGALLLDLNDPTRVIGRLREPLLIPAEDEREGYVPNVVYSCGSLLHQDQVIIPYGISDRAGGIVSVPLEELLHKLRS